MSSNKIQNYDECSESYIESQNLFNAHLRAISGGVKRCPTDAGLDKEANSSDDETNEFLLSNNDLHLHSRNDNIAHRQRHGASVSHSQLKNSLPNGKKTKGRVKIKMEFIDNKLRRYTTFSKRKTGIMKKAYELSTLTGTQVMLLVASETGHVYTFATRKLQPMITSDAGKALIQTCLNSPDPPMAHQTQDQRMSATGYEEPELSYAVAEDEHKSPQLPEEYLNGSSSCSGSESSLPCSPSSPMIHPGIPCSSLSPIPSNTALTSGGTVKVESSSSGGGLYGNPRSVIFSAPQISIPEKNAPSSILLKIPSALNHLSQNEGNLVSLPLELASDHFEAAFSNTVYSTGMTNTSQCLPTDLSLPIKREYET